MHTLKLKIHPPGDIIFESGSDLPRHPEANTSRTICTKLAIFLSVASMVTTTNPLRHLLSSVPKGVLFSKDLFSFSVSTHAIQLPAKNIATVQKALDKELFLAVPRIKTIIPCPVDKDLNADTLASHRLILMNFDVSGITR